MTGDRYSRQVRFQGIGKEGQARVEKARVAVVGLGALGTVSTEILARAGVRELILVDRDFVEASNLQRQSLYTESDAAQRLPKAVAADQAIRRINSTVKVTPRIADLTFQNIAELCGAVDLIVDATDNFETRYLINDFAVNKSIPWVYGGCVSSHGLVMAIVPGKTPCLQCLFPEPPAHGKAETCETAGIIAPAVHVVSAAQSAQALRILVGHPPSEAMFQFDVWENSWRTTRVSHAREDDCTCCGKREFRFLRGVGTDRFVALCGRNAVQITPAKKVKADFQSLQRRLDGLASTQVNEYLMRLEVDGVEISVFQDGRSIIKGTGDPALARTIYARYIGL